MKTFFKFKFLLIASFILVLTSCVKDLDKEPIYGLNSATVYNDFNNYKPLIAKVYGGLSLSGSNGPGSTDIAGLDGGSSGYVRVMWKLQELTSDEAICGWTDAGIPDLNNNTWSSSNQFVNAMYYRIYYQIALANDFLRNTESDLLNKRSFTESQKNEISVFRAEMRFMRALNYYHLIDMFGKGPFIPEDIGGDLPKERSRVDHFNYIESELKAIENSMANPRSLEYGRVDRGAAWFLLTKLYLNAKVYTGNDKYTDAAIYAKKVIDAGYTLETNYRKLFLIDNFQCTNEIIFPIISDGLKTQSFGTTTFLQNASLGGNMIASDYGTNQKWGGLRAKQNLSVLFTDTFDRRNQLYTTSHRIEIQDTSKKALNPVGDFKGGYAVPKFRNVSSLSKKIVGPNLLFCSADFPLFRLGDIYLMYAEALLRSGGSQSEALDYVNKVRSRAYGNNSNNLSSISLDGILDERARELHWEAIRRSDLIRFDKYAGGNYVWQFKGGIKNGVPIADNRKLFPIPQSELTANPNISQNPGY